MCAALIQHEIPDYVVMIFATDDFPPAIRQPIIDTQHFAGSGFCQVGRLIVTIADYKTCVSVGLCVCMYAFQIVCVLNRCVTL